MKPKRNEKRWIRLRPSSTIHYSLFTIHSPKAFTLVELLTVIVIISMLATISLIALNGAYTEAKIAKTRGTIAKLDAAIQQIFEEFEEKYESLASDYANNAPTAEINTIATSDFGGDLDKAKAALKLHFVYDLMRMVMPARWDEVGNKPSLTKLGPLTYSTSAATTSKIPEPPVFDYYFRAYMRSTSAINNNGPAELLYLIIANLNPESLENLHGSEIGDTDGNGLLEFIDAWGNPIFFIRAAPGFTGSDRQPDVVSKAQIALTGNGNTAAEWNPTPMGVSSTVWANPSSPLIEAYEDAVRNWKDPFDSDDTISRSWFLYPVILSAGPDGKFTTVWGRHDSNGVYIEPSDAATLNPFNFPTGIPDDISNGVGKGSGVLQHLDNIHNHRHAGGF